MMALPSKMRSFRFRIAALSTLLSGLVLAAFGAWAWTVVQRMNLQRLDEDLREMGRRQLSARQGPRHWANVNDSLRFVLGDEQNQEPFILLVKGPDDEIVYQSDTWPEELPAAAYPPPNPADFGDPADFAPAGPDGPGRGPRGRNMQGPGGGNRPLPSDAFGMETPPDDAGAPGWDDRRPGEGRRGPGGPGRPGGPPLAPPIKIQAFLTRFAGGQEWRIGVMSSPEATLALGFNMNRYNAGLRALRNTFLVALPAALLLIAAGAWWVAQRALRPVRALTAAAEGITAQGLDRRIPAQNEDAEFNRLIMVFNGMMDRLEQSFRQAVRFSADAAHELKTPLTILQGELEQALQSAPAASPQQQAYSSLLGEVQRLKTIIRKLLLLSLADSGQLKPHLEALDFTAVLEAAIEDAAILAPTLTIEKQLEAGVCVAADGDLLRQVVQNLVSNAIKYNRPDGTVRLHLRRDRDRTVLRIANTGPGIPADDRDQVFERFYRADKARNRTVDGLGLGLSLSREIARAHHGDLVLESSDAAWTVFTLSLPARSPGMTSFSNETMPRPTPDRGPRTRRSVP